MEPEVHDLRVKVDTQKMEIADLKRRLSYLERRLHMIEEWGFWLGVIFVAGAAIRWILKGTQ
jgi:hypothetical protein